jgi:thermitase
MSLVRLGVLTALVSLPALVLAPAPSEAGSKDPTLTELMNEFILASPWLVDGGIDPTNAPVVSGDFVSLSASIAPTQAPIMKIDDAAKTAVGTGVVVAILDSGFNLKHPAVSARWTTARYDAYSNDKDPNDLGNGVDDDHDGFVDGGVGHGTFVASLIARSASGAKLMPIRIADDEGRGTELSFASGMNYAINNGAHVINLSFSLDTSSSVVTQWLNTAESRGITVVCAAGNGSTDLLNALAAVPTVVAVGAVGNTDVLAPFSNFGSSVRMYAQGVDILGAYGSPTVKKLAIWSGTSFSAGFVSGAAALVKQRHSAWTPSQIRSALYTSCDPAFSASGAAMPGGRINLLKAVQK